VIGVYVRQEKRGHSHKQWRPRVNRNTVSFQDLHFSWV
jgi:hypothetical protein